MLKGTTKIDLTDVKTGEKEVYENHPLICNFKLIEDDIFNDFINFKDELA